MHKNITEANQNVGALISQQAGPIILDFWAPWCGPCQQLNPVLVSLAEKVQDQVHIIKVDVDHHQNDLEQYGVRQIPTLVFINSDKQVVGKTLGYKTLEELKGYLARFFGITT